MLDLASIEAGQLALEVEEFDLASAMSAVAAIMQRRAKADRLQFVFDCPPDIGTIAGDQRRIKQVAFNLLSNAFKFTPSGGHIAFALRREGDDVVMTVADTGIGITREDQLRVFEKFRRGRGANRYSGTGIGLSLVKSFVELHGGTVTLESQPNAGTRVVCRVPAGPRPGAAEGAVDAA
jgi:signal transduction histidine kinase